VATWHAPTLEGRLVRLEPLTRGHADGLWDASRDPRTWRWLSVVQPVDRRAFDGWLRAALDAGASGAEIPLATVAGERVVGWTWLHPDAWGTGVNVEAKLLMLRHAFERWGCRRVELKTDALNERSRGAMEAMGATFEGIHRKHMLVRDRENRDSAWYSVTDDEWPAVERGLVGRLEAHGSR
jgi:N-acetyltransferase